MRTAIVFSAENKSDNPLTEPSSSYEKMAIGLAYSIREHMPDIDVYCGNFTNNELSSVARLWFRKLNVNLVRDHLFSDIGPLQTYMFLRNFTMSYFAKKLLGKYDYIIYLDLDVLMLQPFEVDFDPTGPFVLVDRVPQWTANYHAPDLNGYTGNLYFNWVSIINQFNYHIFDLDYTDPNVLAGHNSNVMVSKRIETTKLEVIDQQIGGYHCLKPVNRDSLVYHYDALGPGGSLHNLAVTHPEQYEKYRNFFENVLNIRIINKPNYWEDIAKEYNDKRRTA